MVGPVPAQLRARAAALPAAHAPVGRFVRLPARSASIGVATLPAADVAEEAEAVAAAALPTHDAIRPEPITIAPSVDLSQFLRSSSQDEDSDAASSTSAAAAPAPAAAAAAEGDLLAQLAVAEAKLRSMFESGRAMPSAAEVAQAREAVATLRSQLSGEPAVITLDLEALRSTDLYAAAEAYEDLPEYMGVVSPYWPRVACAQDAELYWYKAENERLRAVAEALLTYEAALEELLDAART